VVGGGGKKRGRGPPPVRKSGSLRQPRVILGAGVVEGKKKRREKKTGRAAPDARARALVCTDTLARSALGPTREIPWSGGAWHVPAIHKRSRTKCRAEKGR